MKGTSNATAIAEFLKARPEGIDYVIPGNDDASKAVALYAAGVADAILEGRANAVNEVVQAARGDDGDEFVEVNAEA